MDIDGPQPEEMAAPPPWEVVKENVDQTALVREVLLEHPEATVEEVVGVLAAQGISVNSLLVARVMQQQHS